MPDSADMQTDPLGAAASRLDAALASLERALDPMLARLERLERQSRDGAVEQATLAEDRARLAARIDQLQHERDAQAARFEALAAETARELDGAIGEIRTVLGNEP